jgi:hypothetical protein
VFFRLRIAHLAARLSIYFFSVSVDFVDSVVVVEDVPVDEFGGGVMMVVLDFAGSPAGPCGPAAPCGPGTGVDCGTGTGVTVVFSHALKPNTPARAANNIAYLMGPLLRFVSAGNPTQNTDRYFPRSGSREKATNTYLLAGKYLQGCQKHGGIAAVIPRK